MDMLMLFSNRMPAAKVLRAPIARTKALCTAGAGIKIRGACVDSIAQLLSLVAL